MSDASKDTEIAELKQQVAELSGLSLATGIILTQLLQKAMLREMSPQKSAGEVVEKARTGIEEFAKIHNSDPAMKQRALDAVTQYEEQIRSVLPV